ncbi:MAG: response regulator transcription factor [Fimbriimonadaceae bacterium]
MRVAVVAKNALLRDGLMSLLMNDGNLQVIGCGEFISQAAGLLADMGLLVVSAEGLEVDDWITLGELRASGRIKVILITTPDSPSAFKAADVTTRTVDGGAALIAAAKRFGSLRTEVPIKASVGMVNDSSSVYTRSRRGLTRRELEVAKLVAQGMSNRRVSQTLDLQEQSVKNLVSSVMRKLGCENRVQVALKLTGQPTSIEE